jgi:arabinofuranan 3-O-arabinosyltransferase
MFGYPPFAALAFVPFAVLDWPTANHFYVVFQVCVAMAGSALLGATLFHRHRFVGAAAVTLALLGSQFFWRSVHLYNVSLLMMLPLVTVSLLWSRSAWKVGTLVLGVSVAVKPLLALVFLVPLARRHFSALMSGVALVLVLTAVGAFFSHDIDGLVDLPRRVLLGANELGDVQIFNVSPNSIGIIYPQVAPAMIALRIALGAGIVATMWRSRQWTNTFEAMLIVTGVLAMTMPLVGTLSEIHYSILAFPMAVAMGTGRLGRPAQAASLLGLVLLGIPFHDLGDDAATQIQLCAGQVLVMVAAFLAREPRIVDSSAPAPPTRAVPQPSDAH